MLSNMVCRLQILQLLALILNSLSVENVTDPYPWNNRYRYYFTSAANKMTEVLSPGCLNKLTVLKDGLIQLPASGDEINVASFPVKQEIIDYWRSFNKPNQMRVDPNLCDAVMRAKKNPIFNNTGCQLPGYMNPSAPRCQNKYLRYICDQSRIAIDDPKRNGFALPESDHKTAELPPQPWLLTVRNSFVSMCGSISTKCGLVHTMSNCKGGDFKYSADTFQQKCSPSLMDNVVFPVAEKNGSCLPGSPWSSSYEYHDKVFVVAETDDTYVYHLHLEIIPRMVYHLDFLLANPDIKIIIGCDSKKNKRITDSGIAHMLQSVEPLLKLTGISMDRLIVHKHVYAKEIYFPMEGGCQDPVYNTWQILNMRAHFMSALNISQTRALRVRAPIKAVARTDVSATSKGLMHDAGNEGEVTSALSSGDTKPIMLLMKRSARAKHTRNSADLVRAWTDAFTEKLMIALRNQFPGYEVKLFSDRDEQLMSSQSGIHGAGLSNQLYMKPNSAVVELCPYPNDGRCLLGGGPFSRIAAVMSHNYMIHHPPHDEYKWLLKEMASEFDIKRFIIHINSFLQSVNAKTIQGS